MEPRVEEFGESLRRALQAPGAALPYCGLNDVGCNGRIPSCVCLDYLYECDPTTGTCSPMTVGMALVLLLVACVITTIAVAICCNIGAGPDDTGARQGLLQASGSIRTARP